MFASSVLPFVDSVPLMLVMCDEGLQIFQGSLCDFFLGWGECYSLHQNNLSRGDVLFAFCDENSRKTTTSSGIN